MKFSKSWLWPAAGVASLLLLWHFSVVIFHVKPFVAPSPLAVLRAIVQNRQLLLEAFIPTATEALAGFFVGNVAAVLMAAAFVYHPALRRMYFPVAVIFNTIPIIAVSPILILFFGLTVTSKIIIAAIICFFPTLVNTIRGFESASVSELELMRILAASKFECFIKLRAPRSTPFVFSALRIACTTSVIGAIVSEWIGAEKGIGVLIMQSTFEYKTELLYSAIATSSALALTMFGLVSLAEHLVVRWRPAG
ncbi:MAG: ABC transporter permease [Pseudomonadota bacterium]